MKAKELRIKRPIYLCIIIVFILIVCIYTATKHITVYNAKKDAQWYTDQINFSQYLYYANRCIDLADKHQIQIDSEYRENIEVYTKKLLKKVKRKYLNAIQTSQLIWLDYYYEFGHSKSLYERLDEFYDKQGHLFKDHDYDNKGAADVTYLIYGWLNDVDTFKYDVCQGLADFCIQESSNPRESIGLLTQVANILVDKGNSHLIDKDEMYKALVLEVENDIFNKPLIDGSYDLNIESLHISAELEKFYKNFGNDEYKGLSHNIFKEIQSVEQAGYYIEDPIANVYLYEVYKHIDDLKQNPFISSNFSRWLSENYDTVIKSDLARAFD